MIGCSKCPNFKQVLNCLNLLQGTYLKKGHIIEPLIVDGNNFKAFLLLAYYRNSLVHIFLNEATATAALLAIYKHGLSQDEKDSGVEVSQLWSKVTFIQNLLSDEFIVRNQIVSPEDLKKTLLAMQNFGIV